MEGQQAGQRAHARIFQPLSPGRSPTVDNRVVYPGGMLTRSLAAITVGLDLGFGLGSLLLL